MMLYTRRPHQERRSKQVQDPSASGGSGAGSPASSGDPSPKPKRKRIEARGKQPQIPNDPHSTSSGSDSNEDENYRIYQTNVGDDNSERGSESEETASQGQHIEDEDEEEAGEQDHDVLYQIRVPFKAPGRRVVAYTGKGMTKKVKRLRQIDPREKERMATRFRTLFQQDYYETGSYCGRVPVDDWAYMESKRDPIFDQIIQECKDKMLYDIMGFKHDWNTEIIAQFYATAYFAESGNKRKVYWMTEGTWYNIGYFEFGRLFNFRREDYDLPWIHHETRVPKILLAFMYPPENDRFHGQVRGIYSYYRILNRMFRKTLVPKSGNPHEVAAYGKNLLAHMKPSTPKFSVFNYIWEEIKLTASSPHKACGFATYLMHMIEHVTQRTFRKDVKHTSLQPQVEKHPIIPTPSAVDAPEHSQGQVPVPPPPQQLAQTGMAGNSSHSHERFSPIRKIFNMIFGLCKTQHEILVEQVKQRRALEKMHQRMIASCPALSEEETLPLETFEERMAKYQQDDPCSTFFGYDGFRGSSSSAPPPPQ